MVHRSSSEGRHPTTRILSVLLCACLGSQAPVVALAAEQLPNLGDTASDALPPAQERKIGEEIMREAREAGEVFDDPESTEYLNQFGDNLIAHAPPSPQSFEFFLVQDKDINAFAMPGGFIGVNTGLIIATQSEAELASVMAHEMGHVIQHHIARGVAQDQQDSLVALAAMVLGLLAAAKSNNPNGGEAVMTMTENYMFQKQAAFSRDAEREADRVGFQILQAAQIDPSAMTSFFGHLQKVYGIDENGVPDWARDHPMTSERIADIQNRISEQDHHYRQTVDNADFQFVRARLRVLQDTTVQGLADTRMAFEDQLRSGNYASQAAIRYGLAMVLLKQKDAAGAQQQLDRAAQLLHQPSALIAAENVEIRLAEQDPEGAVSVASAARAQFPQSRSLVAQYAKALQAAGRYDEEIAFLRDQLAQYRTEAQLYDLIAKGYAAKGESMLEHEALAENYYLRGSVSAAIEQLQIARRASNGDFYELSQIDARMRDLQAQWLDIKKDKKDQGKSSSWAITPTLQASGAPRT